LVKNLPLRSEVHIDETWNLQDLFKSEEDYNTAVDELEEEVDIFADKFKGNITDSASAIDALNGYLSISEKVVPIGTYTSLASYQDQTDDAAQMRSSKFGSFAAKINSKLSFVNSELSELPTDTLDEAMKKSPDFKNFLEKLIQQKEYQLHPEAEKNVGSIFFNIRRHLWLV